MTTNRSRVIKFPDFRVEYPITRTKYIPIPFPLALERLVIRNLAYIVSNYNGRSFRKHRKIVEMFALEMKEERN